MPEAGEYTLSNIGFSPDETPYISFQHENTFIDSQPLGKTISLTFDTSTRYCIGWGNLATGERFVCPDHQTIDGKYEQCPACQKRTGFNPAFYNTDTVSKQQEERNSQPHTLYLAHFGPGFIKVGISYAGRGKSRLLEQGAKSAIILDTFPTALIARQYEARIAALPNIAETIQLRKKILTLSQPYNGNAAAQELLATKDRIEQALAVHFPGSDVLAFDKTFFPSHTPNFNEAYDSSDHNMISGKAVGMLGSLFFCLQQDSLVFLPLKKYIGYPVTLSDNEVPIALPARQISLF